MVKAVVSAGTDLDLEAGEGNDDTAAGTDGTDQHHGTDLSQAQIFDVLSSQRRRFVIHYLLRNEGQGDLQEIATYVAAWENGTAPEDIESKLRTRAYTTLRQTHLPKMDEYGVIVFEPDSGDITLTPTGRLLREYLETRPGTETNWWLYYLGVGIIGAILGILASGPFVSLVSGYSAALLTSGAVAGLALVQFVHTTNKRRFTDEIPEEGDVDT